MRPATMTAPGVIESQDVPDPSAGPGEVLLRIRTIGICESDVHVAHGQHPLFFLGCGASGAIVSPR